MGSVEDGVRQYWKASLAWKRVPGYVEGHTVETLFDALHPLREQQKSFRLAEQAENLTSQIVSGRVRRKKDPTKNKVVQFPIGRGTIRAAPVIDGSQKVVIIDSITSLTDFLRG